MIEVFGIDGVYHFKKAFDGSGNYPIIYDNYYCFIGKDGTTVTIGSDLNDSVEVFKLDHEFGLNSVYEPRLIHFTKDNFSIEIWVQDSERVIKFVVKKISSYQKKVQIGKL
jgi:hypothetical protein